MVKRSVVFCLLCSLEVSAQSQIYKSTDQQGRVVYSDRPPADAGAATAIEMDARGTNVMPSAAIEGQIADQRKRDDEAARRHTESRRQREMELERADRELAQAEEALARAQVVHEGDLVGNAGGGVRPDAAWVLRLEQAQAQVEEKTRALERLRGRR